MVIATGGRARELAGLMNVDFAGGVFVQAKNSHITIMYLFLLELGKLVCNAGFVCWCCVVRLAGNGRFGFCGSQFFVSDQDDLCWLSQLT